MKLLFKISLILIVVAAFSCKSKKSVVKEEVVPTTPAPSWVQSRPISPENYIGIGFSRKTIGTDHIQTAKNGALNDLASEISVTISSSSFLFSVERDDKFTEEYQSNIQSTINKSIKGYEQVDAYETDTEYWIIYKLSKAKYADDKQREKQEALNNSLDLYSKALTAEKANDVISATNLYLKSLLALKSYWNETNKTTFQGTEIYIDNEIYSKLNDLYKNVLLTPNKEAVTLNYKDGFQTDVVINTTFKGTSVSRFPVTLTYSSKSGKQKSTISSNEKGEAKFVISNIKTAYTDPTVKVAVDFTEILDAELKNDVLIASIANSLKSSELTIPVIIEYPLVYITSTEKNLGQPIEPARLKESLKEGLTKKGFQLTTDKQKAELIFTINASTREGGSSGSFKTAYLDYTITVTDPKTGTVILKEVQSDIKGVQNSFEKAGIAAYKKGNENFNKKIVSNLLKELE